MAKTFDLQGTMRTLSREHRYFFRGVKQRMGQMLKMAAVLELASLAGSLEAGGSLLLVQ